MSGGDPKIRQWLDRFASPFNVTKTALEARRKIGSNEYLKAKPEVDGNTPEGKAALEEWRGNAGIPKSPDGYLDKLPNGIVVGEADKGMIGDFLSDMHAADAPPAHVHAALGWYYKNVEKVAAQQAEDDKAYRAQGQDELRGEWGAEYRGNINGIKSLFSMPDLGGDAELMQDIFSARMPNGRMLGDNPAAIRFLERISREINPQGTVVPSGGGDLGKDIDAELKDIESKFNTEAYLKGGLDARYRELLALKEKRKGRAA